MGQRIEKRDARDARSSSWRGLLVVGVVVFAVFVTASYLFDWTWTGFPENPTVWDSLNLLIRPVALTAATIWFTSHPNWRREWSMPLVIAIVFCVLFVVASYAFNWKWTGFPGNRFWDWLNLLLLPVILTVAMIWFTPSATQQSDTMGNQQQQYAPQRTGNQQTF